MLQYQRLPKGATTKICRWCGKEKPLEDFSISRRQPKPVYRSNCKACCAAHARNWAREHVERASANKRRNNLRWMYGMTIADYDALLAQQGGVCAICRQSETVKRKGRLLRMPVDHDHKTGEVRGILCHRCNRALGLLNENAFILRRAISYLGRTSSATRKVG